MQWGLTRLALQAARRIFEGFGKGLGRVWAGFWEGFGKVLGRSGSLLGALGASQGFFVAVLVHFWVVWVFFNVLGQFLVIFVVCGYFGLLWDDGKRLDALDVSYRSLFIIRGGSLREGGLKISNLNPGWRMTGSAWTCWTFCQHHIISIREGFGEGKGSRLARIGGRWMTGSALTRWELQWR